MYFAMTYGNKEYTLCLSLLFLLRDKKENSWVVLHHIQLLRLRGKKTPAPPVHNSPNKLTKAPRNGLLLT